MSSMDEIMQSQLDRVEAALKVLVDSIAAYAPSESAADELISADVSLSKKLEELSIHHHNHARIRALENIVREQDRLLVESFTSLEHARQALNDVPKSIPSLPQSMQQSKVNVEHLFALGRQIAKNRPSRTQKAKYQASHGIKTESRQDRGSDLEADAELGVALRSLPSEELEWLDPSNDADYTPWPSEELIRQSALAQMQNISHVQRSNEEPMVPMDMPMPSQEAVKHNITTPDNQRSVNQDMVMNDPSGNGDSRPNSNRDEKSIPSSNGAVAEGKEQKSASEDGQTAKSAKSTVFGGLDLYDPEQDD